MTEHRCDNCDATTPEDAPGRGWRQLSYLGAPTMANDTRDRQFCSLACVARWASERVLAEASRRG